ncbi:MAG: TIR domain-containing protein [Candidatus Angelobacter sp.]
MSIGFPNNQREADPSQSFKDQADRNVFIMVRYGEGDDYRRIEATIRTTLKRYKFNGVLARDRMFKSQLWDQIHFCMEFSRYGIVIFEENLEHPEFNPNVSVELGFMMALDKKILILKEKELRPLPSDLLGYLYVPFSRNTLEKDIDAAVAKWLFDLGHIPLAETIACSNPTEGKKERTKRIIEALRNGLQPGMVIRHAGALSSLAISEKETLIREGDAEGNLQELLLEEHRAMVSALENGAIVRCMISPDVHQVAAVQGLLPPDKLFSDVLPRLRKLIEILERYIKKPSLQMVYVARLPWDNMLMVGDQMFLGRRRMHEWGFPSTTIIRDPEQLRSEIAEFDELFGDVARIILSDAQCGEGDFGAENLKERVIEHLIECCQDLERRTKSLKQPVKAKSARMR